MADPFPSTIDNPSLPSRQAVPIVPSDGADLALVPKGIYVGTGGDLAVIGVDTPSNTPVTFKAVPSGSLLPFRARRVMATNTTASNLLAML